MRPYEFIRNGPVLHHLPVRIVGIGGGLDYGTNGMTHYALEDVALMRAQPELTVVVPADARAGPSRRARDERDCRPCLSAAREERPAAVPGLDGRFELGRAHVIGDGTESR